jgi:hypothetical protein
MERQRLSIVDLLMVREYFNVAKEMLTLGILVNSGEVSLVLKSAF